MIELRPLTAADVTAHNAGEDAETVRWLSGVRSTEESTRRHIATLTANAARGRGKRGFGIWWDDRLAGYIDVVEDGDGPDPRDVVIAYAVHPWARRRGVASTAVDLLCRHLAQDHIAARVVIRVDPANTGSVRVAERCGFRRSSTGPGSTADPPGAVVVFVRDLTGAPDTPTTAADTGGPPEAGRSSAPG